MGSEICDCLSEFCMELSAEYSLIHSWEMIKAGFPKIQATWTHSHTHTPTIEFLFYFSVNLRKELGYNNYASEEICWSEMNSNHVIDVVPDCMCV